MPELTAESMHQPVLLNEALDVLHPERGGLFIDATLGMGGHSEALLNASAKTRVIGIDQDQEAIRLATTRLERFGDRLQTYHGNFSDIKDVIEKQNGQKPVGILADLGVSSLQFDSAERGFSFRFDAPLDMRMDRDGDIPTAAELLATLDQDEIADIIYKYGEERASRKIARWIVERREKGEPVETTTQLADIVRRAVGRGHKEKIDPATRTFQALRIAVNRELDIIDRFITDSVDALDRDGVLAVITFHSLEDRIVKLAFQRLSGKCQCPPRMPVCQCGAAKKVALVTRKPITPTEAEQRTNPRSRSAKLRACRKLEN